MSGNGKGDHGEISDLLIVGAGAKAAAIAAKVDAPTIRRSEMGISPAPSFTAPRPEFIPATSLIPPSPTLSLPD